MNAINDSNVLFQGELVTLMLEQNGNLAIHATEAFENKLDKIIDEYESRGEYHTLTLLFRGIVGPHFEFIDPIEIKVSTSAPIFAENVERNIDKKIVKVGRVWWHDTYQIESIAEELIEGKTPVLTPLTGIFC